MTKRAEAGILPLTQHSALFSTFTINILFVMLIIIGAAVIPLLSLQLNPTRHLPSLTISWIWPEAPVRVVEQEVTTVLEGVLSTVTDVNKISHSTTEMNVLRLAG